ncbi:MAG: hypothetical protein Q9221_006026 [Calogaya cf. arnoldii]
MSHKRKQDTGLVDRTRTKFTKTVQHGTWCDFLLHDANVTRKSFARWWDKVCRKSNPYSAGVPGEVKTQIARLLATEAPNPISRRALLPGTLKFQDHLDLGATREEVGHARNWVFQHDDGQMDHYLSLAQPWCYKDLVAWNKENPDTKLADREMTADTLPNVPANATTNWNRLKVSKASFLQLLSTVDEHQEQEQEHEHEHEQENPQMQAMSAPTATAALSTQGQLDQQTHIQYEHAGEEGEQTLNPVEKQVAIALLGAMDLRFDQVVTPGTTYRGLGGTSVQAPRVLGRFNKALDCEIQLWQFYRDNIPIRQLTELVSGAQRHEAGPSSTVLRRDASPITEEHAGGFLSNTEQDIYTGDNEEEVLEQPIKPEPVD